MISKNGITPNVEVKTTENKLNTEEKPLSSFNDIIASGGKNISEEVGKQIYFEKRIPDFEQDGGYEIHPDLKGITFNFWVSNKESINGVAVSYLGNAENAPWAYHLTGKVFQDFSVAKHWLRERATILSEKYKREQSDIDEANKLSDQIKNGI